MKKIIALLILMTCLMSLTDLKAQVMTAMRDSADDGYNFWLYEPDTTKYGRYQEVKYEIDEKSPLIIFLHGASLKGIDMNRVLKYGPLNSINRGIEVNAYVVAPQTPYDWNADKIWKDVEWVVAHYPIDENRISVIGMSLGGFGTFELSTKYYDKLAAAMMLCGGNTNTNYCGLTKMPLWIMHGTADRPVPISRSNSIVNEMAACGDTSRLLYTKLKGADHGYPARLFYLTETYDWLTSHSLSDEGRAVNRSIEIPQSMITNAYSRLSGKEASIKKVNEPKKLQTKILPPDEEVRTSIVAVGAIGEPTGGRPEEPVETNPEFHTIVEGNTLSGIAVSYRTTVPKLCELNNITEEDVLLPGHKIRIRKADEAIKTTSEAPKKEAENVQNGQNPAYHTVVSGNTLYSIAKMYNTTIEKLCELNDIKEEDLLQLGQKIKLPQSK